MIGPATIAGAEGHALSFTGEFLTATLSKPFAPGTPLKGTIRIGDDTVAIEGRAIGSKRIGEGLFEVKARLINMRKADRERLVMAGATG